MERYAPRPLMLDNRMRIRRVSPTQLTQRLTAVEDVLELSSMGIPDVSPRDWTLDITGLVERVTSISFEELKRLPKQTVESVFVCSGDPRRPTVPLRRVANVKWGGVDLAALLDRAGVRPAATHLWSYGLDHGDFFGIPQHHYVKDMPLSRLAERNVLIAYEMNDAPLRPQNGFPARLVIPGFYGTNCVKWLCRLELRARRATHFMTTRLYGDPVVENDPAGTTTKPVGRCTGKHSCCPEVLAGSHAGRDLGLGVVRLCRSIGRRQCRRRRQLARSIIGSSAWAFLAALFLRLAATAHRPFQPVLSGHRRTGQDSTGRPGTKRYSFHTRSGDRSGIAVNVSSGFRRCISVSSEQGGLSVERVFGFQMKPHGELNLWTRCVLLDCPKEVRKVECGTSVRAMLNVIGPHQQ